MEKGKVLSFIIPTYNCEAYLDETLSSVLCQLPEGCELILVDDGSTDSTPEMLRAYEKKSDLIRISLREHGGASTARNAGLDMAKGEWVAFMDCDDCLKEGFFARAMPKPEDQADLYIFSFERVDFLPGVNARGEHVLEEVVSPLMVDDRVYETASDFADIYIRTRQLLVYSACNKFYRKSLIDEHGIRFVDGMSFGEDRLFNYDYLMHTGRIITSQIRMFRYMQRNPNSESKKSFPNYYDTIIKLHRAKIDCFFKLSRGTTGAEKRAFAGADLSSEVGHMIDRFDDYPAEKEENLPKINELVFGRPDDISGSFDVIIVLGSTDCGYRLDRAYEIAGGNPDTVFVVTGGNLHRSGELSEAEYMAERLRSYGVPEGRILVENNAENTYRNLELSAELIEKSVDTKDLRIGIVTAAFHVPRTRMMAASIPWYEDKHLAFIPAYSPKLRPDSWYANNGGKSICLGELAKCYCISDVENISGQK